MSGLLPAAILGLDIKALRAGAATALAPVLAKNPAAEVPAALGAALNAAAAAQGKNIAVLMAYADRLERFSRWYVQLWAESLGKDGKGTTPLGALGPVDQHSQLQLFIAGPRDKLFTVITVDAKGRALASIPRSPRGRVRPTSAARPSAIWSPRRVAQPPTRWRRTAVPCARSHLPRLDEESLGALMMHFFLETIIAAHLFGVEPFDQPAVEEGKVLAKQYLAGA